MSKVKISYDEAVKLGLTKECSKCHKVKAVKEFGRHKGCKYGANSECKECRAKYYQDHKEERARYLQEHKEEIANRQRKYDQEHREEKAKYRQEHKEELAIRQRQYYQEHKEEKAKYFKQYYQEHKEEKAKYIKQYCQDHKEEITKYKKQYNQAHKEEIANQKRQYLQTPQGKENKKKADQKRRALKNNSFYEPFTQEDKEFCLNYFNHKCPYTGKQLTDSEPHLDHIVALSDKDGIGATAPWNMLLCDASANMSKSNKPILEFINSLPNADEVYNKIREYIILQAKRFINIIPKDDITLKTFNITFEELEASS